jgi:hypothetical protein
MSPKFPKIIIIYLKQIFRAFLMNLFHLLIYGLFNGTVSSSVYTASSDWLIYERQIMKHVVGSSFGLFQGTIPAFAWRD